MDASIKGGSANRTRPFRERSIRNMAPFILLVLTVPTVALLWKSFCRDTGSMQPAGKRTVQVNVKMTAEDFDLLKRAADKLWPDAILSNSGIILGLAKIAAREVASKKSS